MKKFIVGMSVGLTVGLISGMGMGFGAAILSCRKSGGHN